MGTNCRCCTRRNGKRKSSLGVDKLGVKDRQSASHGCMGSCPPSPSAKDQTAAVHGIFPPDSIHATRAHAHHADPIGPPSQAPPGNSPVLEVSLPRNPPADGPPVAEVSGGCSRCQLEGAPARSSANLDASDARCLTASDPMAVINPWPSSMLMHD